QSDSLIHLLSPLITVNGVLSVTDASGLILLNAGTQMQVSGLVDSKGAGRMNAGVDVLAARSVLESPIAQASLSGGRITVIGAGTISAVGGVALHAGGDVNVIADATVSVTDDNLQRSYVTVE